MQKMVVCNCKHRLHTLEKNKADLCSVKTSDKQTIKIIERRCDSMTTVVTDIVKQVKKILEKCVIVIFKDPFTPWNND